MRIIEAYAKKAAGLDYILRDEARRKEFFSGILGHWNSDSESLPGEWPDAKELAENRAKLGKGHDIEGYKEAMRQLVGIGHDLKGILPKTRALAENNPGYPDFAKIHLALLAICREIDYQRHALGD